MGSSATATIGVVTEGTQQAARDLKPLVDLMERLNGGGIGSNTSTPSNAPPNAPKLFNPVIDSYASPTQAGIGGWTPPGAGWNPGGGVLNPSMSFNTGRGGPLPPGALAQMPTGASGGYNVGGGGSGPGGQGFAGGFGGGFGGGPINVYLTGSAIPLGGGSGGGSGNGNGTGGNGGSGTGSGQQGSKPDDADKHPLPNWKPALPDGFGGLARHVFDRSVIGENLRGVLPKASYEALLGGVAKFAGPIAIAAGVLDVAETGVNMWGAGMLPRYNLQTQAMAANASGQYVNPIAYRAQQQVAADQGGMNEWDAFRGSFVGKAFRFAGLGIPDAIWNYGMKPSFDRKMAMDQSHVQSDPAIASLSFLADAPVGRLTGANLEIAGAMGGQASMFGTAAVKALINANSGNLVARAGGRVSAAQMEGALGNIYATAGRLGQSNMFGALTGGGNPLDQAWNGANVDISQGDLAGLASLQTALPKADYSRLFAAGVASRGNLANQAIAQAGMSSLGAKTSLLQATGAGYGAVAGSIGAQAGGLDAVRSTLQYQMRLATNGVDRANIQAQLDQLDAQQAGLRQSAAMTVFQGRGVENSAFSAFSQNSMTRAMYGGGGQAGVDRAYGNEAEAAERDYRLALDQSKSPYISTEQRKVFAQAAESARVRAQIGVPRERSQYDFGVRMSQIGVGGATADAGAVQASLFGGPSAVYNASMAQASVTGAQLRAVQGRLSDTDSHLSVAERNDLLRQEIDLRKQEVAQIENSKRALLAMNVAVAQTQQSITASQVGNAIQFLGVGGAAAGGLQGQNVGAAAGTYDKSKADFDYYQGLVDSGKMSPDHQAYLSAKAGFTQAQAGLYGSVASYASLPTSQKVQEQRMDASFALSQMSHAFMPFGDMRGAIQSDMNAIGTGMRERSQNQAAAMAQIDQQVAAGRMSKADGEALKNTTRLNFKREQMGDAQQAYGDIDQYVNGFQNRMVDSVVNMPSRGKFVTAGFGYGAVAPYMKNLGEWYNGRFGYAGAGGGQQRDDVMANFPSFMRTMIGHSGAQGFASTAMAMSAAGMASVPGGVLRPGGGQGGHLGTIELRLSVDSKGNITGATTTGRGGSSPTIHALANGALTMTLPLHAATASHQ